MFVCSVYIIIYSITISGSLPSYSYADGTTTTTSGDVTFDFSGGNFGSEPCVEVVSTGTDGYGAAVIERVDDDNLVIDGYQINPNPPPNNLVTADTSVFARATGWFNHVPHVVCINL